MVTVVNNPSGGDRVVEVDRGDSAAGWAIAVIVLLAVIAVGAYYWTHRAPAQPASGGTNINVTVPSAGVQPSGNSGGTQPTPTQ